MQLDEIIKRLKSRDVRHVREITKLSYPTLNRIKNETGSKPNPATMMILEQYFINHP